MPRETSFTSSVSSPQLEEASALFKAEQEETERLKKSQADLQKQVHNLEANLREIQEKCSHLENGKAESEKQLMGLRAELEEARREHGLRTETISDLQGETPSC